MSIKGRLLLIILFTGLFATLAIFSLQQVSKGALFHQLNTLHLKYTIELKDELRNSEEIPDLTAIENIIKLIRQQPIETLNNINAFDTFIMTLIGTESAIQFSKDDINVANQSLNSIEKYKDSQKTLTALHSELIEAGNLFGQNSSGFEIAISKTVQFITTASSYSVIALAIVVIFAITRMAQGISKTVKRRELAEKAQYESETRFRTIFENAGDAIYIHDRYGKILDINQVAVDQLGYTRDKLLSMSVAQLDVAVDFDNLRETWDLGEGKPEQFPMTLETAHRCKDGSKLPIEVRISLLSTGQDPRLIAMVRDISARKLVEAKLNEKMRELDFQKAALDEHAIVSISDTNGNITYANDKFCDISGFSREELIYQNHRILKSNEHKSEFYEDLWKTIANGKPWHGEIKNFRKNGESYWVKATIVPFLDEQGKPFQYVAIRTDITEQRESEYALLDAKDIADKANQAKSEFLSSMSHELRTPLNSIIGFSQLLLSSRKETVSERQRVQIGNIHKAGGHLLDLINEILDLSSVESGKVSLSIEKVDFYTIAQDCLTFVESTAYENNITVELQRNSDKEPKLKVDNVRCKQIIINLLSNAIKYNRPNGNVWLHGHNTGNGLFRINIVDTGFGIPEEKQAELFMPFNRLGAEHSNVEGTGVGLFLTKKIVEQMGGKIGFSSIEGSSSTFWVELPLFSVKDQSQVIEGDQLTAVCQAAPIKMETKILYVEDNQANIDLMENIVSEYNNLSLISIKRAELCFTMACEEKPDIIVLDLNLPGMSGFDALAQLKLNEETSKIPTIALSADALEDTIKKVERVGFNKYLSKPINVNEFIATINGLR